MHEWSLIVFTILTQIAVGAFVVATIVKLAKGIFHGEKVLHTLYPVFLLVAVAALTTSFLHLGSPSNAWYALNNFGSSWLSREILFVSLFTGGLALLTVLTFRPAGWRRSYKLLAIATSLFGIAAIYSMAKIYMLPTIPVWNSTFTLVQFFLTTIILGGALTAIFIPEVNTKGKAIFVNLLLVLVLASIMVWVGNTLLLAEGGLSATKSLQVLVAENSVLFYGRIVLLALVVMVILLPWFRRKMPETISFFTMLFVMLLIAEVAGRYLFYASYVRTGV